jgi:Subtilase family
MIAYDLIHDNGCLCRRVVATVCLYALAVLLVASSVNVEAAAIVEGFDKADKIPGSYLILFDDKAIGVERQQLNRNAAIANINARIFKSNKSIVEAISSELALRSHARGVKVWHAGVHGFHANMSESDARALAVDPRVAMVVADQQTYLTSVQISPPWQLDRIDQIHMNLDNSYTFYGTGEPNLPNSQHVVYVTVSTLDSGARLSHREFNGRVLAVYNYQSGTIPPHDTGDCNGHGTEVAALITGTTFGVAKSANVSAYRIVDCTGKGAVSDMMDAISSINSEALTDGPLGAARDSCSCDPGAGHSYSVAYVINSSVQVAGVNSALVRAVETSISDGVVWVSSAGPGGSDPAVDACTYTPAGVPGVITVASSGYSTTFTHHQYDRVSSPAPNYGSCVTLFAPGEGVKTAGSFSDIAIVSVNGTSFSAPLVTGVVAMYLSAKPLATQSDVRNAIVTAATPGALSGNLKGSPNLLLYTNVPGNFGTFLDGSGGGDDGTGTGGGTSGSSNSAALNAAVYALFSTLQLNN